MKNQLLLPFLFIACLTQYASAQYFDKYGASIGASNSSQLWNYKYLPAGNYNQEYKLGWMVFLSAEKDLNENFSLRPEIGYIQKGYRNNYDLSDDNGLLIADKPIANFHNIAANLSMKITPLHYKLSPYLSIGLRGDYRLGADGITVGINGQHLEFHEPITSGTNKFNLGGLLCFGLELNDLVFAELEYNPSLTESWLNEGALKIREIVWGLKLGLNINKL